MFQLEPIGFLIHQGCAVRTSKSLLQDFNTISNIKYWYSVKLLLTYAFVFLEKVIRVCKIKTQVKWLNA